MATETINCETIYRHNKYGYCKCGETCRYLHVNYLCERSDCEIYRCEKRHPRECKYWREYRRCKFNEFCSYSHKEEHNTEKAACDTYASDLEHMKSEIEIIEKLIDETNKEIKELEKLDEKFLTKVNQLERSFNINCDSKLKILEKELNVKVENIGTQMMQKTESNFHNIDKLEKKVNEVDENNFILVHAVDDIERASN